MSGVIVVAYVGGLVTVPLVMLLVKLRAKVERRNWWRITFGPAEGQRKLSRWDVAIYGLVHPWKFVRTVVGIPKWSPFHEEPKPRPSIDAAELFPKPNIPE